MPRLGHSWSDSFEPLPQKATVGGGGYAADENGEDGSAWTASRVCVPGGLLPSHSMSTRKSALVLDERPNLFVGKLVAEADHRGPRRPILDHPKEFTLRTVSPKTMMVKISRGGVQCCRDRPIASSGLAMTIHASALALVERFPLGTQLSRIREGARQSSRFSQLVGGNSRLHIMMLCRDGEWQRRYTDEPAQNDDNLRTQSGSPARFSAPASECSE